MLALFLLYGRTIGQAIFLELKLSSQRACRQAAKQTGLPLATFPEACPYSIALVLDEDWLPG